METLSSLASNELLLGLLGPLARMQRGNGRGYKQNVFGPQDARLGATQSIEGLPRAPSGGNLSAL